MALWAGLYPKSWTTVGRVAGTTRLLRPSHPGSRVKSSLLVICPVATRAVARTQINSANVKAHGLQSVGSLRLSCSRLSGAVEPVIGDLPVHHVPPCGDVVGPAV